MAGSSGSLAVLLISRTGETMASSHSTHSNSNTQSHTHSHSQSQVSSSKNREKRGVIGRVFQFLSKVLEPAKSKTAKRTASPASASASAHHPQRKTKIAATKSHSRTHSKTSHHRRHRRVEKPDSSLRDPNSVIPDRDHDRAHSPGHRHLPLDKEIH